MGVYLVTFWTFFLACLYNAGKKEGTQHRTVQLVIFVILVVQAGLRWQMGTDWLSYFDNFEATSTIETVLANSLIGFELGYGLLTLLVHSFTDNYAVFLLIHALIFYVLVFDSNNKLSSYPIVSLLLFYSGTIGVLGSNRQLLALSVCLFSLKYVFSKEKGKFLLAVVIAALFHTSALLFGIYYFLNRSIKKRYLLALIVVSIAIGYSPLPQALFERVGSLFGDIGAYKANYYSDNSNLVNDKLSISGLIKRLLIFMIVFFRYETVAKRNPRYTLIFNGYFVGLLIYFLFSNSLLILVNRGGLYFNIMEAFLLAGLLGLFKTPAERYVAFIPIFLYSILMFYQGISGYLDLFIPYQGVFINTGYSRQLY